MSDQLNFKPDVQEKDKAERRAMRKREALADPDNCINRARDDEHVFTLLGRDAAAPVAVRAWVEERLRLGKNQRTDPQILTALQWINEVMEEQRRKK